MARFFIDSIQEDTVIFHEDAQHIARILRLKPGDTVTAVDGTGMQAEATLLSVDSSKVTAKAAKWHKADGEPDIRIHIFQGICKYDRFETVVQKCTELGAVSITPLHLVRCEIDAEDMDKRLTRLRKIAREAAKQSGRGVVPSIEASMLLTDIDFSAYGLVICPYEQSRDHGLRYGIQAKQDIKEIAVIVGPEGGMEPLEAGYCEEHGACIVTLGPRILRTETAAPAVLSVLMAQLGEWDGEKD